MNYISIINEFIKTISSWQKATFIAAGTSWLLYFLPPKFTSIINIPNFRDWILIGAIVTTSFFILGVAYDLLGKFLSQQAAKHTSRRHDSKERSELARKQKLLLDLTLEEKRKLSPFIKNNTQKWSLKEDDVTIQLEDKDILYHSNMASIIAGRPNRRELHPFKDYYLREWAYRYLIRNPHLLSENRIE